MAHTPKRQLPITQNDLAGSKKLAGPFDSVFKQVRASEDEKELGDIKQLQSEIRNFESMAANYVIGGTSTWNLS